jgi:hypothetical protein
LLKAIKAEKPKKNQYPAYAVKSDDGTEKPKENQYPAYAVKSDDGKLKDTETPGLNYYMATLLK